MRKVRCHDCGRTYDYDVDDFCPKCGAFNQPLRGARIDPDGNVVRVDGLNERGHAGSFVHRELHEEERERRRTGLDQSAVRERPGAARPQPVRRPPQRSERTKTPFSILIWIVLGIIVLNFFAGILAVLF